MTYLKRISRKAQNEKRASSKQIGPVYVKWDKENFYPTSLLLLDGIWIGLVCLAAHLLSHLFQIIHAQRAHCIQGYSSPKHKKFELDLQFSDL